MTFSTATLTNRQFYIGLHNKLVARLSLKTPRLSSTRSAPFNAVTTDDCFSDQSAGIELRSRHASRSALCVETSALCVETTGNESVPIQLTIHQFCQKGAQVGHSATYFPVIGQTKLTTLATVDGRFIAQTVRLSTARCA